MIQCKPKIAIYAPMIYKAPYVMFLMSADPLRGQVGGGWALEFETFGALKCQRAKRVPFGAKKVDSVSAKKQRGEYHPTLQNRFFFLSP
jgi:hypothetical protein